MKSKYCVILFCAFVVAAARQYYDPVDQKRVELPSGYNEGWVNGLGEYILSDNPTYNPNVGSNPMWHRMEKK